MPKTLLTLTAIAALKPGDKPYAVPTGVPNLRVHVSPKGTKTFQLRRNGTMITLGRCDDMPLAEARRIAITGETPEAVAKATRTIGEWIKLYERDKAHLVSCRIRAAFLRLVLGPILKREVSALTTPWLEQRFAELKGSYKPRTLRTYRTNVVMLASYIVDHDGLAKSPFRRLSAIPVDRRVKFLGLDDMEKLERWCEESSDLKLACFTMIALHTGMRRSEILTLAAERNPDGRGNTNHTCPGEQCEGQERPSYPDQRCARAVPGGTSAQAATARSIPVSVG